ncbi:T9SS type A sorting domain-containing protein, partial [Flavobacterium sp. NRK F10]|uniref:T9SS type A sorting domain-containing protein n=1 Tax=Flavobacterium sp. NRK F10 TaxID=2954931 RepID=UPI00208FFB1D
ALTQSSQTNIACNGGSTGEATVNAATGGAGGYTYNWTPGNPTGDGTTSVTGLTAGTWTCTVTDANGCTTSTNFTIIEPTALALTQASQTNIACNGGSTGEATVNTATGGAGGYTYSWSPSGGTGTTATGLVAGTYTCTVTDANGCTDSVNFTITEPTALALTQSSQTNIACNGGSTGAATVNAATGGAGGYTYSWSPSGGTGTTATGLVAGTYTCTVTDTNGCTTSTNFTITEPTALALTQSSQTDVACNGGSTGAATVNAATGGAGGYTYNWTPGNPTGDGTTSVTGLTAGTWTCTVTDANGCTTSTNFTITEPTAIDDTVTENLGVLTANQSGATYQWYSCPNTILTGETNQSYTPTVDGDYKVEITVGSCTVESICTTVLSAEDFERNDNFVMYPNPAQHTLYIKTKTDKELVIINQLGQTVKKFKALSSIENTINISNLSEGIYLIIDIHNSSKGQKLIINN